MVGERMFSRGGLRTCPSELWAPRPRNANVASVQQAEQTGNQYRLPDFVLTPFEAEPASPEPLQVVRQSEDVLGASVGQA